MAKTKSPWDALYREAQDVLYAKTNLRIPMKFVRSAVSLGMRMMAMRLQMGDELILSDGTVLRVVIVPPRH